MSCASMPYVAYKRNIKCYVVLAVNIATALSARGKKVHLTTTDPAAHVALTMGKAPEGIQLSRVDPD